MRPWEIWHLQSDNSKLYNIIESRPETELSEAIRRTVEYFYANGERWGFQVRILRYLLYRDTAIKHIKRSNSFIFKLLQ